MTKFNYSKNNFKVFLSDGASYCRKIGVKLKEKYNCKHIICGCHNLHNFAEYLRKKFNALDKLISFLKRISIKNKTNKALWKSKTNIALPNWPILTRWETWIICGIYLLQNKEFF